MPWYFSRYSPAVPLKVKIIMLVEVVITVLAYRDVTTRGHHFPFREFALAKVAITIGVDKYFILR